MSENLLYLYITREGIVVSPHLFVGASSMYAWNSRGMTGFSKEGHILLDWNDAWTIVGLQKVKTVRKLTDGAVVHEVNY